ncbi:MAG: response regulator [Elusimicrobia bacterium]|nr:response regulator [Elusimicrobiota bacterium]
MKILIADDEAGLRSLLADFLKSLSYEVLQAKDGAEAVGSALADLPDLIVLDVEMPVMSGFEACRILRGNIRTRYIPILFLTSKTEMPDKIKGLMLGADDYLAKPFHAEELKVRIESIVHRSKHQLSANPLTKLPGGPLIEEEAVRRIKDGQSLAFAYIDIDHFKAYNDVYGYKKGDEVISWLAKILIETVEGNGVSSSFVIPAKAGIQTEDLAPLPDFIGHIGGDDFVLITYPQKAQALGETIAQRFDAEAAGFYGEKDKMKGFLETTDRQGALARFPLMSISIAIVTNERRPIEHYAQLVETAAELKHYAKSAQGRTKSLVVMDRRKE